MGAVKRDGCVHSEMGLGGRAGGLSRERDGGRRSGEGTSLEWYVSITIR